MYGRRNPDLRQWSLLLWWYKMQQLPLRLNWFYGSGCGLGKSQNLQWVFLESIWKGVDSRGGKADESSQAQVVCVYGGRLEKCGKSKRSKAPADGHRSDSSGMPDAFPIQRSSGSGRVVLRLTRPPGLWSAKIFSHFSRCSPYTHTTCAWLLSVL